MTGPISGYPLANWNSTTGWNFNAILSEFRSICGIPDAAMYSDAQCATLINYYYQYVLPKELKIFWGYTNYQFYTVENIDQYPAPANFQTFNPEVYCDGFPIEWNIDPSTFYSDYPQQENKVLVATADGVTSSFTFQIPSFPVLARSVYVTDGTQVAVDVPVGTTGTGSFVDPNNGNAALGGSIDYSTGVVSGLTFKNTPVANASITCTSQSFFASRPQEILFYPQQPLADATQESLSAVQMFTLRPVPDQVYIVKIEGIQVPPAFLNYTDVPFRPDLGPLIALGAALHRFKLFNQMDQYAQYLPEYNRFKDVCMQDTYEEYIYTRSVSKF